MTQIKYLNYFLCSIVNKIQFMTFANHRMPFLFKLYLASQHFWNWVCRQAKADPSG